MLQRKSILRGIEKNITNHPASVIKYPLEAKNDLIEPLE